MATPYRALKHKSGITMEQYLAIAKFCAEEVSRQYKHHPDAEEACLAVGWMIEAWLFAIQRHDAGEDLSVGLIEEFGRIIEPEINREGFRTCDIWVGGRRGMLPPMIRGAMFNLVKSIPVDYAHDPDQAYKAFEEIHPFGDGNGRTGKIIFNWLKGLLRAPEWPYNFWGCSNP